MTYAAVLPPGYERSMRRYPVLYLLHGFSGDHENWVKRTELVNILGRYPMIVVTPEGHNSWYVNSATQPHERYEDYLVNDVVADVDANFRSVMSPHRRAIAGLSMGGYGAVLMALKHPQTFAVAGSLSGAFDGPVGIDKVIPVVADSIAAAFGPPTSPVRAANDVYRLAADSKTVPYLFVACGAQDPLLASNRKLVDVLSAHKIDYEYHEYAGAHTWEFWDTHLAQLLDVVMRRLTP